MTFQDFHRRVVSSVMTGLPDVFRCALVPPQCENQRKTLGTPSESQTTGTRCPKTCSFVRPSKHVNATTFMQHVLTSVMGQNYGHASRKWLCVQTVGTPHEGPGGPANKRPVGQRRPPCHHVTKCHAWCFEPAAQCHRAQCQQRLPRSLASCRNDRSEFVTASGVTFKSRQYTMGPCSSIPMSLAPTAATQAAMFRGICLKTSA